MFPGNISFSGTMKRKKDTFSENFLIIVLGISYLLSCLLIYGLFLYFTPALQVAYKAILTLLFLIAGFYFWVSLYMLITIPQKLSGAFDPLTNSISRGTITDAKGFAAAFNSFVVSFFNFSFLDVKYAVLSTGEDVPVCSSAALVGSMNWEEIRRASESSRELQKHGRVSVEKERLFAYTIPVWFSGEYLGFFTIFTTTRMGRLRLNIFIDLEEHQIDDQLYRVLHH